MLLDISLSSFMANIGKDFNAKICQICRNNTMRKFKKSQPIPMKNILGSDFDATVGNLGLYLLTFRAWHGLDISISGKEDL